MAEVAIAIGPAEGEPDSEPRESRAPSVRASPKRPSNVQEPDEAAAAESSADPSAPADPNAPADGGPDSRPRGIRMSAQASSKRSSGAQDSAAVSPSPLGKSSIEPPRMSAQQRTSAQESVVVPPSPLGRSSIEPPRMSVQEWTTAQESPQRASQRASAHSAAGGAARKSARASQHTSSPPQRKSAHAMAEGLEHRSALTALADEMVLSHDLLPRMLAECVGTCMLVLTVGVSVAGWPAQAAFAIGGILAVQIYTFGSVSGGLFNPAVTLAVLLSGRKKITPLDAGAYMFAQFLGALFGGWFSVWITDSTFYFDVSQSSKGNDFACCMLEMFYTAALCIAVLTTGTSTDTPNHYFGFAIGGTVMASAIACGKYDQGSFNPAVTFGINMAHYTTAALSGPSVGSWFLYLFLPFLGSILAAGAFLLTRQAECFGQPQEAHTIAEKLAAESLGTFYLVFTVGVASGDFAPISIGVMLAVQVYAYGSVSGACLNPAVALSVMLSGRKKLSPKNAGLYMVAEFIAALVAAVMARFVTDTTVNLQEWTFGSAMLLEIFFTFALCMTVLSTGTSRDAPNEYFGFAIGGTVTASAYAATKYKAGSFNPAVTFGIMLTHLSFGGTTHGSSWAVFLLGPWIGGVLAAAIFYLTRRGEFVEEEVQLSEVKELADAINTLHGSLSEGRKVTTE